MTILVILIVRPKLIVGICLWINNVYMDDSNAYKIIVLLMIPILFNVVIRMCKHNTESHKTTIEEHGLVITYKNTQPMSKVEVRS